MEVRACLSVRFEVEQAVKVFIRRTYFQVEIFAR